MKNDLIAIEIYWAPNRTHKFRRGNFRSGRADVRLSIHVRGLKPDE